MAGFNTLLFKINHLLKKITQFLYLPVCLIQKSLSRMLAR